MSKHTPGPWVSKDTDFGTFVYCERDYLITGPLNERSDGDNARLIAAAPDLLESLTLLVAGIENSVSDTYIPLVKASAAIAKATGEIK